VTAMFGPLDASGRVPALQQTRVSSFLISAHGAHARLLAAGLASPLFTGAFGAGEVELHQQLSRELELISLLALATKWQPDSALVGWLWRWEMAWLPQQVQGLPNVDGGAVDAAAFGYALHTGMRPAALLPPAVPATDPFAAALRRLEAESSRTMQVQLRYLKSPDLAPAREAISAAVDRRHAQMRELWTEVLASVGVASSGGSST